MLRPSSTTVRRSDDRFPKPRQNFGHQRNPDGLHSSRPLTAHPVTTISGGSTAQGCTGRLPLSRDSFMAMISRNSKRCLDLMMKSSGLSPEQGCFTRQRERYLQPWGLSSQTCHRAPFEQRKIRGKGQVVAYLDIAI